MTLLCTVASLKIPVMIAFDAETKVLVTEILPQHNNPDLNSGITFILFSQEKPLRRKEIHTCTPGEQVTSNCGYYTDISTFLDFYLKTVAKKIKP